MPKIRSVILALGLLMAPLPAAADVSIGIGFPYVSIGVNVPAYPRLVRVPGHPVYYAPHLGVNFFFYDGLYWVFHNDNWYASSWYNGPWAFVSPYDVPVFILRIPVRYYRHPPTYFRSWRRDDPPHWRDNWGDNWERRRGDWDRRDDRDYRDGRDDRDYRDGRDDRDRRAAPPPPAPLPSYQREYSREQYPRQVQQQHQLLQQKYRYQPREPVVRHHYEEMGKGQDRGRDQGRGRNN